MREYAKKFWACLHGGRGPQVGEVTHLGGVIRLSIYSLILKGLCQLESMRSEVMQITFRWGDPPHIASPFWGPPPPCKQALIP